MIEPQTPTLDALRVFLAIADTGSFVAASRRLGRATSVVSYQLANLETQLGLTLLNRRGAKKVALTEAGQALVPNARAVAREVDSLLARARGLIDEVEAEVSLVVDVMMPMRALTSILEDFRAAFPTVPLRLHVEAMGAVAQLVLDGAASLGVGGPVPAKIEGLEEIPLFLISMVPVAAPCHPLAAISERITPAQARDHVQLVLTDRSHLTKGQEFGVFASRTWHIADLRTKHAFLLAGLGWGWMPETMVDDDLAVGRLVRLSSLDMFPGMYRFRALYRTDKQPGRAGRWLLDRLQYRDHKRSGGR
jgi:DNA-binding transcriptional LysR family regulator